MSVTLKELQRYLDGLLQGVPIQDYCVNGLQVEGGDKIERMATAVSASLATIESAVEKKVQALLVHHGLFWSGDNYAITGVKRSKLNLLLKNEISLLAYHLPLDLNQHFGNNWKAARDLGWIDLQPFGKFNGIPIGVKGRFSPLSREALQGTLEKYYQHPAHCALGGKEIVQSAALISGGAYKSMQEAINEDIDCFITGNFDEPVWHQAIEGQINFFALGHSATERVGPKALGEHLQSHFNLPCEFIDIYNPF